MLAQRDINAARARELGERRVEDGGIRGTEKRDRCKLAERAGVRGDGAHPVGDGASGRPARSCPRIEDRVTARRECGELGVEDVVCRGWAMALEDRETGAASREDDVIESCPLRVGHQSLRLFYQLLFELGLAGILREGRVKLLDLLGLFVGLLHLVFVIVAKRAALHVRSDATTALADRGE